MKSKRGPFALQSVALNLVTFRETLVKNRHYKERLCFHTLPPPPPRQGDTTPSPSPWTR